MSEELKIRKFVLKCFQSGLSASQTSRSVEDKFHVRGFASRTCQRWFKKFRDGDFDLSQKPKHEKKKPKPRKKEVKIERVVFPLENRPRPESRPRSSPAINNDVVQRLIQRNQITVSKVGPSTIRVKEPSKLMPTRSSRTSSNDSAASKPKEGSIRVKAPSTLMSKRISLPLNGKEANSSVTKPSQTLSTVNQRRTAGPELLLRRLPPISNGISSRSLTRQRSAVNTDLRLPPSIAKRMVTNSISTENHTISEATKTAQRASEPVKKSITVQFQNVSPEVAKNTVRKSTETGQSSANSSSKKSSAQSSNPLAQPKGVIYLNPQEIFGEKINHKSTPKKTPAPPNPPPTAVPKPAATPAATPAQPPVVTVDDSDSEDDLVFPENMPLPPPKLKAVVNTFTTYWDMETDKPILLNPTEEVMSTLPVIELE